MSIWFDEDLESGEDSRDDALPRIREGVQFEERRSRVVGLAFRQRPVRKRVLPIATKDRKIRFHAEYGRD